MSSSADRLEDGFPHGTVEGFNAGCRGGWCPEGNEHGLSCKKAKQLDAGDYRYQRLVKRGLTPGAIADELGLAPETHQPPKRKTVLPEDDTDDLVYVEPEESIMPTTTQTPTPKPAQKPKAMKSAPKPAPRKAPAPVETTAQYEKRRREETRAWAAEHGVHIGTRGRIPGYVVEAFAKNDPTLLSKTTAERLAEDPVEPATHDEAPETGTRVSEAQGASEDPTALDGATQRPAEGVRVANAGEFAAQWNSIDPRDRDRITDIIRRWSDDSNRCLQEGHADLHPALEQVARAHHAALTRAEIAEDALALTLQKWDAVTQQLRLEKVVNEVLRAAHKLHIRLLESASASAEKNDRILDDYAAEIRRNHDQIARLRDELEQARQPWWKRAAS